MSTLSSAINASASALSAERTRIEIAVSNMANAESTRGPDGQPYRRRDVVLAPDRTNSFDAAPRALANVFAESAASTTSRRRYGCPSADRVDSELARLETATSMRVRSAESALALALIAELNVDMPRPFDP